MSAELLREAAALMRERAEATVSIFSATGEEVPWHTEASLEFDWDEGDAAHIAAWSPAVALAVAGWLDSTANDVEHVHSPIYNLTSTTVARAFAVARAYLGRDA